MLAHPHKPPRAYLDDNTLVGEPDAAIAATRKLLAACAPRGLLLRLRKCEVSGSDPELVEQTAAALQFTAWPDGMLTAGTPVGTDAFKKQHCLSVADKTCALIDKLMLLPEIVWRFYAIDILDCAHGEAVWSVCGLHQVLQSPGVLLGGCAPCRRQQRRLINMQHMHFKHDLHNSLHLRHWCASHPCCTRGRCDSRSRSERKHASDS